MNRRHFIKTSASGMGLVACNHCLGGSIAYGYTPNDNADKFTCEALFYKKTANGFQCELCPTNCNINAIRPGTCRTKEVRNGKLVSTAYGNPYYVNTESPELESLYHFMPGSKILTVGTAGCTLACMYCKVFKESQKKTDEITHQELFPIQLIQKCIEKGIKTIAYAYTEPIAFYEYMLDTAKLARQKGIKNVLVSNGYINESPLREIAKYLDAAVIDVKAFSDSTYQKLTNGSIFPVFKTLKVLKELNVWTEITHLLVPTWTDNFDLLEKMCEWMIKNNMVSTPFHFNKLQPMNRLAQLQATSDALLQKAKETATASGLKFVYVDNFSLKNFQHTTCPKCNKVLVDRNRFKVLSNKIKSGKCSFCQEIIPGVW